MITKKCTKCKQELPATTKFFHRNKNTKDGLVSYCKACRKKASKDWWANNSDRNRAYKKQRRKSQPSGIYQIINRLSGRLYIGYTTQGTLNWWASLSNLRAGRYSNRSLQEDFKKFGESAFIWSILKELPKDKKILNEERKKIIDKLTQEGRELYNTPEGK